MQPRAAAGYSEDARPDAHHFAAFQGRDIVGVASVYQEDPPNACERLPSHAGTAWRLRGMATAAALRGSGVGMALLNAARRHAREHGGTVLWCNARTNVSGFYRRGGLEQAGSEFDLPSIGPHVFMKVELPESRGGL
ncbi:MAG: GNAT family N-acetyltransferase [Vulcanimicrobiaceae bacterium]